MSCKDQPRVPKGNPGGGQWTSEDKLAAAQKKYSSPSEYGRFNLDLNFFGKKKKTELKSEVPVPIPKEVYGFKNKERLNTSHHKAHAKAMGFKNQDEYQRGAIDFWKHNEGTIYRSKYYNRFTKYDKKNEILLSVSPDGIIHTFMPLKKVEFKKKMIQDGLYEL